MTCRRLRPSCCFNPECLYVAGIAPLSTSRESKHFVDFFSISIFVLLLYLAIFYSSIHLCNDLPLKYCSLSYNFLTIEVRIILFFVREKSVIPSCFIHKRSRTDVM